MRSSFGLWRAVLHRSRADWPVVAAAWLLLLAAISLLVAGVLYGETVATGGLRRELQSGPPTDRVVVVEMATSPRDLGTQDETVSTELERILEPTGGSLGRVVSLGTFADAEADPSQVTDLIEVAAIDGIADHAILVDGTWPEAGRQPMEASLSVGAAASLGLTLGDRLTLVPRVGDPTTLEAIVSATWRPDPEDAFWLDDELALKGATVGQSFTTRGPLVAPADDLLARPGLRGLDASWRAVPDLGGLRVDDVSTIAAEIGTLNERIEPVVPPGAVATVTTGLPERLTESARTVLVSRSEVLLLILQFAILAGYAIVLVAGLLLDRRTGESALLRSRGAGRLQIAGMALAEAVLLAIPAVILSPVIALGLVRLVGALGPLGARDVIGTAVLDERVGITAVLAGLFGVAALTLPALLAGGGAGEARAAVARQSGRTLAGRTGLDLALLVVAVIGLLQLRLYGAPLTRDARGTLGIDPLLVAAPAIALLAGAILAVRIVPRVAELAERVLERRPGLVSPLGARQLARRPLRYTRSALLLMLAAALGTFAVAHSATWSRSQLDQAAYLAAADVRIIATDYPSLPSWVVGPAIRSVPGVAATAPVARQSLESGRAVRDGEVLALDPTVAPALVRPDAFGDAGPDAGLESAFDALGAGRPETPAVTTPEGTRRLAVVVDTAVSLPEGTPPEVGSVGDVVISLVLADGDGRLHRLEAGRVRPVGQGQRVVVPLQADVHGTEATMSGPVRIQAVELESVDNIGIGLAGIIDLRAIESSPDPAGDRWVAVPLAADADGWAWERSDPLFAGPPRANPYATPSGQPARIDLATGRSAGAVSTGAITFRLAASAAVGEVPAIVGRSFADATGAGVGDSIAISTIGVPIQIRVAQIVERFPPLDPTRPFVLIDRATAELARFDATDEVAPVAEWWVDLTDGDEGSQAETVATLAGESSDAGDGFDAGQVIWRVDVARELGSDPIPLALIGALALGALAALVFAAIGFIVSATVSTAERMGEFALLQAVGLSHRQLAGWLSIESAALLAFGLGAGVALGLLLAWLVLPFATLTATGAVPVPAPVVVVPWLALLPLAALAVLLLLVTVALTTRQLAAVRIGSVLRSGGG